MPERMKLWTNWRWNSRKAISSGETASRVRIQAIKGSRHRSRHHPAWTIGAGGHQAPATASFPNPEPFLNPSHLSSYASLHIQLNRRTPI